MERTASNLLDVLSFQRNDRGRSQSVAVVCEAKLTLETRTPSKDLVILAQGNGMRITATDKHNLASIKLDFLWCRLVGRLAMTKLSK